MSGIARGEIVLEHATRSFKLVHERPRTLKELVVSFGRRPASEVCALRDFELNVKPGSVSRAIGRTLFAELAGFVRHAVG